MQKEKLYFNPGCALSIYKPDMETRLLHYLNRKFDAVKAHHICCHHDPKLSPGSTLITVCSGCNMRFRTLYEGLETLSIWEIIDSLEDFPYPSYEGITMTLHDACPNRDRPQIHKAVRSLLHKMNIQIEEARLHGASSVCCGDDLYGKVPTEQVHAAMKKRADSMPSEDVVVYCISCIKSMYIGGKKPKYLLDLLMGETTEPGEYRTEEWHAQLQDYISRH